MLQCVCVCARACQHFTPHPSLSLLLLFSYKSQCLFLKECDDVQTRIAEAPPGQSEQMDPTPTAEALAPAVALVEEAIALVATVEGFPTCIAAQ